MSRASRKSTNKTLANRVAKDIVDTVTGVGKRLSKTVTGSSDNILTKTTDVAGRTVTGTVDTATDTLANTVDYAGNVATDFVDALQDVVSGLIDGASSVVETTGDVTERLLTDVFDVRATHVFNGAGNLVRRVANGIGGVMREIPYVGNTTGYVVEAAGGGVYHVILSVGKLVGSTSRRVGSIAKKSSDLVVFTLNASDEQLRDTTHSVDDLLQRLSATLSGSKAKSLRQAGGRGRRSRRNARNVRKTRGGGRGGGQRRRRSMHRSRLGRKMRGGSSTTSENVANFIYQTAGPMTKGKSNEEHAKALGVKKTIQGWRESFEDKMAQWSTTDEFKSKKYHMFTFADLKELCTTKKDTINERYKEIVMALYDSLIPWYESASPAPPAKNDDDDDDSSRHGNMGQRRNAVTPDDIKMYKEKKTSIQKEIDNEMRLPKIYRDREDLQKNREKLNKFPLDI